jgi:hypothetical protein
MDPGAFSPTVPLLRQSVKVGGDHGEEIVPVQHGVPGFLDF